MHKRGAHNFEVQKGLAWQPIQQLAQKAPSEHRTVGQKVTRDGVPVAEGVWTPPANQKRGNS